MKIHKLAGTDAFVVFDLDDAPTSIGITRLAPKILVDGATLLARTNTYLFASFGQKIGGASAGINAKPDDRSAAIAAFVDELAPMAKDNRFVTEAGKGVSAGDVAALAPAPPFVRPTAAQSRRLLAAGVAEAAAVAAGDLDGKRVAIEGLDKASAGVVAVLASRGARIVAVSTAKGTVVEPAGFDAAAVVAAVDDRGPGAVEILGPEVQPVVAVFGVEADVLVLGTKAGVLDDEVAAGVPASVLVPLGPVPVTAKALALLTRRGAIVVPDFVSTAGPLLATVGVVPLDAEDADGSAAAAVVAEQVRGVLGEVLGHERGALLGACFRAEAFLSTWQPKLPFGRPIA